MADKNTKELERIADALERIAAALEIHFYEPPKRGTV